jgi:dienelactone hydrolase
VKARKILMATMGLEIGGPEPHIVELSRELVRRGYEVAVASNGGVYVPEIEAAGIRHHTVPLNRRNAVSMMKSFFCCAGSL